ncbi:maleylpyruvate isomerase N-terminal domain-containing protein [Dyadobacter pollutisoli]|uniref:Maleylpyruvate isomerase N-terminal domain-containing protein n=1 Tax=Dyadobacter pollutisoli TaxID=2910158 RepID=A0A9E8SR75_9BACT|nr:maleylpyruvate isomerase N-terminal domain-containing protein [Dyadobacter pollutisoli]WAC13877.1 maleylpyruvate isomerase N-terminal domain-containing protein [Dyadobacter pollutisoli]
MIETVHLFPQLDAKLIELLKSLSPDDWNKPTVARLWTVKDVAAHLLDGNMRTLSLIRDGHSTPPDRGINSYADLVAFLNQFNADWIKAFKRISPKLLTELLETTGKQYSDLMQVQEMDTDAVFSVAWAGEETSKNWFHIAREYTEKWHHQQQIRDAVDKPGIMTRELFLPFIETLLRGLPHTYRDTDAAPGTGIHIQIDLEGPMEWYLVRQENHWEITTEFSAQPIADIQLDADTAWKLFTKALTPAQASATVILSGNESMAAVALNLIAVMA